MDNEAGAIIIGGGVVKHHIMNANLMRNGCDHAVLINTGQVGWSAVPFHLSLAPSPLALHAPRIAVTTLLSRHLGLLARPFSPR